jgi:putative transcriptional regulator
MRKSFKTNLFGSPRAATEDQAHVNYHSAAMRDPRPLDTLLADYAAGRLSRPLYALVGAHLEIRPENRGFVRDLEALQAARIEEEAPRALSKRDAMLAAILDQEPEGPVSAVPARAAGGVLPARLHDFLGSRLEDVRWRTRMPGVKEFHLDAGEGVDATLYWIRPGRTMPQHTHEGSEVTLVLAGGFSDVTGHYLRGDIAIADADVDHEPVTDEGEDCICFAVVDAPLKLTGSFGKMVSRFLGH